MPFNGTGTFNVEFALVPNTTALAEDINTLLTDIASGLSDALTRDGQAPATANISMGGFQLTDLAPSTTSDGAVTLSQAGAGIPATNQSVAGPVATTRSLLFQTSTTTLGVTTYANRFEFQLDAEAEAGSNAGSNMIINAYADNGTTAIQMAVVTRATGAVSIKTQWDFQTAPTVNGMSILPTGTILAFASASPPNGFLVCDGTAVSRTTYAALFIICGSTYGAGDGSTTFNLPDCRGVNLRGLDSGRGLDAGRTLGTYQADQLQTHTHQVTVNAGTSNFGGPNSGSAPSPQSTANVYTTGGPVSGNSGGETRGKNIAIVYCIKI